MTGRPIHEASEQMLTRRTQAAAGGKEPCSVPALSSSMFVQTSSGALLSQGVSIRGVVKFPNELRIDGQVEGTIDSVGTLTLGEHALIRGEIRTKSVKIRGTVEGNIFVTERCELQAGCMLRGDIDAPRLMVDENAIFVGSAKVGSGKLLSA